MEKVEKLYKEITESNPNLCKNWGLKSHTGQYLYGDVMNYLKDMYGYDKLTLYEMDILAFLLIGNYVVRNRLL